MEYLVSALLLLALIKNLNKKKRKTTGYKKYLQSRHWKRVRRKTLRRYGYKCALCGNTKNLQVHHNSYKNLWHEKKTDLVCLCGYHHNMYHSNKRKT